MTEQNPYARKGALRMEDIKPGLEAVIIGGGRYYHERVTFQSEPFLKESAGYDVCAGELKKVMRSAMMVMASSGGMAASTEISRQGEGASGHITERHLSDMGLCKSAESGRWSGKYTVPLEGYRPEDHE
jgi:hypothetical protein